MKQLLTLTVCAMLAWTGSAFAQDTEQGFDSFDLGLDSVDLDADLHNEDFEYMFEKQDKDAPEQVAAMIAAEKEAWEDHAQKLDKHWDLRTYRAYRTGFRQSYYNGYRYQNRYRHGHQYRYRNYSHQRAYRYSYHRSCRTSRYYRGAYRTYRTGYNRGYQSGYRRGYYHGRRDTGRYGW